MGRGPMGVHRPCRRAGGIGLTPMGIKLSTGVHDAYEGGRLSSRRESYRRLRCGRRGDLRTMAANRPGLPIAQDAPRAC